MTFAQKEKTYKTLFIIYLIILVPLDFSLDFFLRYYDVSLAIAYYSLNISLVLVQVLVFCLMFRNMRSKHNLEYRRVRKALPSQLAICVLIQVVDNAS